ncbi:MAG: hypothetical protein DHS20C12_07900 [Pseudohongiella sp.]|nr:MAG: hypothetical protein DHS20C12_07900 [Pseudohongiella sp.]
MHLRSINKAFQFVLKVMLVSVLSTIPLYAQSTSIAESNEAESSTKSAQALLNELEQEERTLYALFNTLNSSDENDIVCSTTPLEKTDTQGQLCEPVFFEELRQEVEEEISREAESKTGLIAQLRNIFRSSEERSESLLLEKAAVPVELLQQEIESLAAVHPGLLAQLQSIGELQQAYIQTVEAEQRRGDYFMRQNETSYYRGFRSDSQAVGGKAWFSAPPPGQTTPRIHFGHPDLTTR